MRKSKSIVNELVDTIPGVSFTLILKSGPAAPICSSSGSQSASPLTMTEDDHLTIMFRGIVFICRPSGRNTIYAFLQSPRYYTKRLRGLQYLFQIIFTGFFRSVRYLSGVLSPGPVAGKTVPRRADDRLTQDHDYIPLYTDIQPRFFLSSARIPYTQLKKNSESAALA